MTYPITRHRRLRQTAALRHMVKEHQLTKHDLIYPLFVTHGENVKEQIPSMPGVYHISLDLLKAEIEEVVSLGIPAVLLFGVPNYKDAVGSSAYDDNEIVQQATRSIKKWAPELLVIADTCLCQFTDHGHCGIVKLDEATGVAHV